MKSEFLCGLLLLSLLANGCGRPEPDDVGLRSHPEKQQRSLPKKPEDSELWQAKEPLQQATPSPQPESTPEAEIPEIKVLPPNSEPEPEIETVTGERLAESNLPLELPAEPKAQIFQDKLLSELKSQAQYSQSAADWRQVADRAVELNDFTTAYQAFTKEAKIYEDKGHLQAAIAEGVKAAQYSTEMKLYLSKPNAGDSNLQRLEPKAGCYLGAFIDRDDTLEKHQFSSQIHGDVEQFNRLVGKSHASFFMYRAYGQPFPTQWAKLLKSQGAIPHIAWEPRSVSEVQDDGYLAGFLAEAKELDHPVILRFASEMNGEWTRYHGDPEAYKEMFRLVFKLSREAPNVALMWCPNAVPQSKIEEYYPGDEFVDWVGVNFYSVPFLDNNPERSGEKIHPTDHLKFVYDTYSPRKPIAIGEWAASQESILVDRNLEEFATTKLAQLYASLPTRFPRVKMANWYDCNNIKHARADRKLNDFQLTNSDQLLEAYRRAISQDHFLSSVGQSSSSKFHLVDKVVQLKKNQRIQLFLKSYDPVLRVYFQIDDEVVHASDDPSEWFLREEQLSEHKGKKLSIFVFDSKNRFVTGSSYSLN